MKILIISLLTLVSIIFRVSDIPFKGELFVLSNSLLSVILYIFLYTDKETKSENPIKRKIFSMGISISVVGILFMMMFYPMADQIAYIGIILSGIGYIISKKTKFQTYVLIFPIIVSTLLLVTPWHLYKWLNPSLSVNMCKARVESFKEDVPEYKSGFLFAITELDSKYGEEMQISTDSTFWRKIYTELQNIQEESNKFRFYHNAGKQIQEHCTTLLYDLDNCIKRNNTECFQEWQHRLYYEY